MIVQNHPAKNSHGFSDVLKSLRHTWLIAEAVRAEEPFALVER